MVGGSSDRRERKPRGSGDPRLVPSLLVAAAAAFFVIPDRTTAVQEEPRPAAATGQDTRPSGVPANAGERGTQAHLDG